MRTGRVTGLGWEPNPPFETWVTKMVEHNIQKLKG
jgi:hypothetical protein